ncbi:uncharacterized protein LOC136081608 [Hydra vulgaris]|uniref:Uncharacterized protein LOC136081608 n=1 Tax=Hydra vulgaris TaxID=6087 RepID=A0ABM4C0R1_HYDVU
MIWARAVWIENYEKIEDVVPRWCWKQSWIDTNKKVLCWPASVSYHRAVKDKLDNIEELKEYCYTTAEEEEIDICVSKDTFKVKSNVNEYQHIMFKMVSKVLENQELILAINKQPHSNFTIKKFDTIAEYEDFIKSLQNDCGRLDLVKQLSFLGAEDLKN